jgi:alpha-beta hydrolase superfamily lysophospholipase
VDPEYWRTYYDKTTIERSCRLRQEARIPSTGVRLHLDVYSNPDSWAPVIIFNHGAAGYCRIFVQLALSFYDLGYTVVLPDQRGQGLSGGRRGDYTIAECVQNIVDVVHWAKDRFRTPLFMAGGSVGGALTYYAAAAGAPTQAIACLNLLDFGNGIDGLKISRFASLTRYTSVASAVNKLAGFLAPFYRLRIPFS